MATFSNVLQSAEPPAHVVQLYKDDVRALARNVARYFCEGWARGDAALSIATPEHSAALLEQLRRFGANPAHAIAEGRLLLLDAERTSGEFMVDGRPAWDLFKRSIAAALSSLAPAPEGGFRAYGEMVGVLWGSGQYMAALRLEELWNRLLPQRIFSLLLLPHRYLRARVSDLRRGRASLRSQSPHAYGRRARPREVDPSRDR